MCFPVIFAKFLRTPFFIEHILRLLLERQCIASCNEPLTLCKTIYEYMFSFMSSQEYLEETTGKFLPVDKQSHFGKEHFCS